MVFSILNGFSILAWKIRSPEFILGLTHSFVHSVDLESFVMACVHHYNISQSSFTAPKFLSASFSTLATTDLVF